MKKRGFDEFDPVEKLQPLTVREVRCAILKALLRKNSNRKIRIHQLDAELKKIFRGKGTIATPESIDRDLKDELQIPGQIRGYRLHVSARPPGKAPQRLARQHQWNTALEPVVQETISERNEQLPELKRRIAEALWHYLFDLTLTRDGSAPNYIKPSPTTSDRIRSKIAAVRAKSLIACAIDSGSTTGYAMEVLLRVDAIPFRRRSSQNSTYLVRPSIITNSPSIASQVRHSMHAHEIALRIIGGDIRIERASMCGALSELSLDAWNLNSDISIIGTTGVRQDAGTYAFGCDDILEARIKSRMLEMGTLLRVLILDSTKCMEPAGAQIFTSLDSGTVDLIAIDLPPGKDVERYEKVEDLILKAQAEGVGVLLSLRPSPKSKSKKAKAKAAAPASANADAAATTKPSAITKPSATAKPSAIARPSANAKASTIAKAKPRAAAKAGAKHKSSAVS